MKARRSISSKLLIRLAVYGSIVVVLYAWGPWIARRVAPYVLLDSEEREFVAESDTRIRDSITMFANGSSCKAPLYAELLEFEDPDLHHSREAKEIWARIDATECAD